MAVPSLSRDTALRIALAARVLPGVEVGQLLETLHERLNGDISEDTLATVSVADLKKGLTPEDGTDAEFKQPELKEAIRVLWGETDAEKLPTPVPLDVIPERSVRVAIASNSGENLDGHFGSCIRYLIYQLSEFGYQLIDIRSALESKNAENKNDFRAELISDCHVVFVVSVGGPAAAKVVNTGVYPIKKPNGGLATDVLDELQAVMKKSPPPWLAKHFGDKEEDRIRYHREEDVAV